MRLKGTALVRACRFYKLTAGIFLGLISKTLQLTTSMLIPLLNAIYSAFTSNGTLTSAIPNGLHRDQAPEGTALPYVVTHVLESAIEYGYLGACRSRVMVRFSIYGVGHDASGTLCESLVTQVDDHLLTLSGSSVNDSVTRLTEPTPRLHRHDSSGNDVWEWQVIYEYGIRM